MKYYVIYKTRDVGFYKSEYNVIAIVTNKEIAEDFCKKYKHCYFDEEEVGKESRFSSDYFN